MRLTQLARSAELGRNVGHEPFVETEPGFESAPDWARGGYATQSLRLIGCQAVGEADGDGDSPRGRAAEALWFVGGDGVAPVDVDLVAEGAGKGEGENTATFTAPAAKITRPECAIPPIISFHGSWVRSHGPGTADEFSRSLDELGAPLE